MLENENPSSPTDIYSSHHISIFFLYSHAACYPTLRSTIVWFKCKVNAVCSTRLLCLSVMMHILIHKYCIGCSVVSCHSFFFFFSSSHWAGFACFFFVFFVWSVSAENVTDDMVWYELTVCWPQHHPFTAPWKGPVEWPPELPPTVYVCRKTFVTGHLTDKHQVCMLDITACHSMFVFLFFSFNCFVNYFIK